MVSFCRGQNASSVQPCCLWYRKIIINDAVKAAEEAKCFFRLLFPVSHQQLSVVTVRHCKLLRSISNLLTSKMWVQTKAWQQKCSIAIFFTGSVCFVSMNDSSKAFDLTGLYVLWNECAQLNVQNQYISIQV